MTLVELILVMALMLVLLSMVAPQLGRFSRQRVLDATAESVLALLQRAADRAAAQATPCRVEIDSASSTCRLMEMPQGAWRPLETSWQDQLQLPEGVSIEIQRLDEADQTLAADFYADGRRSPCLITLTDQSRERIFLHARTAMDAFVITDQPENVLP
jgi:type II secretory pathway pseudopilin PulG